MREEEGSGSECGSSEQGGEGSAGRRGYSFTRGACFSLGAQLWAGVHMPRIKLHGSPQQSCRRVTCFGEGCGVIPILALVLLEMLGPLRLARAPALHGHAHVPSPVSPAWDSYTVMPLSLQPATPARSRGP